MSLQNLVHCGLTALFIEEFGADTNEDRNRVQFQSDGSYQLLPVVVSRRKRRRSAKGEAETENKIRKQEGNIVELIE